MYISTTSFEELRSMLKGIKLLGDKVSYSLKAFGTFDDTRGDTIFADSGVTVDKVSPNFITVWVDGEAARVSRYEPGIRYGIQLFNV